MKREYDDAVVSDSLQFSTKTGSSVRGLFWKNFGAQGKAVENDNKRID